MYNFVNYRVAVIEAHGQLQYLDFLRFISIDVYFFITRFQWSRLCWQLTISRLYCPSQCHHHDHRAVYLAYRVGLCCKTPVSWAWASWQIGKISDAHAPGMPGTFSPPPRVSDPDMHHGTCVALVPWCMPGSLSSGFFWSRRWGKNVPGIPGACETCNFVYLVRGPWIESYIPDLQM